MPHEDISSAGDVDVEQDSHATGRSAAWSAMRSAASSVRSWPRWAKGIALLLVAGALLGVEMRTSWVQAWVLSGWTEAMTHAVEPGPSPQIRFPDDGPYDRRLGDVQLPGWIDTLSQRGFRVDAQSRVSDATVRAFDAGLYPVYEHKSQAGLAVLDRAGRDVFRAQYPTRVYAAPYTPPTAPRSPSAAKPAPATTASTSGARPAPGPSPSTARRPSSSSPATASSAPSSPTSRAGRPSSTRSRAPSPPPSSPSSVRS